MLITVVECKMYGECFCLIGEVTVKHPDNADEPPKKFTFDAVYDWTYVMSAPRNLQNTSSPINTIDNFWHYSASTFIPQNTFRTEQSHMYEGTARGIVDNVIEGYNGTVFAYGQTGTGKTFSMEGIITDEKMRGVIPRSFYQIFQHIEVSTDTEFLVR